MRKESGKAEEIRVTPKVGFTKYSKNKRKIGKINNRAKRRQQRNEVEYRSHCYKRCCYTSTLHVTVCNLYHIPKWKRKRMQQRTVTNHF